MKVKTEDLRETVLRQIQTDNRLNASHIRVEVRNHAVRLGGTVPNRFFIERIRKKVLSIPDIESVENDLIVKYPESDMPISDLDVWDRIEHILHWDTQLETSRIRVIVKDAHVYLKGTVRDFWSRVRAGKLTGAVPGVYKVTNELTVVPSGDFDDEAIGEDIEAGLYRNSLIDAERVYVHIEEGWVTLTGTVRDIIAFRAVEQIVLRTPGVTGLTNHLEI